MRKRLFLRELGASMTDCTSKHMFVPTRLFYPRCLIGHTSWLLLRRIQLVRSCVCNEAWFIVLAVAQKYPGLTLLLLLRQPQAVRQTLRLTSI